MAEPEVRYPAMRLEVGYAVAAFSDSEFQRAVWVDGRFPRPRYEYSFDDACHAILDDVDLKDDTVGVVFSNSHELTAVRTLSAALLALIGDIGKRGTIQEALRSSHWSEVVSAARLAEVVLGRPAEFP